MLILASASPRRRDLLAPLATFSVVTADVEEWKTCDSPGDLPRRNACLKANAVAQLHPDATVIGADTVILLDGKVIGKPRDIADARRILAALSNRTHEVVTGVAIRNFARGIDESFSAVTRVTFLPLDAAAIDRYLALVPVLDKAGAYGIQEHGEMLLAKLDGDLDNVIGLPCTPLGERLRKIGEIR